MRISIWPVPLLFFIFGVAACSSDSATTVTQTEQTEQTEGQGSENGGETTDGNGDTTENDNTEGDPADDTEGSPDDSAQQTADATYRVTFNASWSEATHPTNFPAGPHFSGLIGAVHSEQAILWEPGQIATDGIELMAETGSKSILLAEVQSVVSEGRALSEISGDGVGTSPGTAIVEFTVTRGNPLVTLVSMVAPSPDWFVGVHGLNMLDDSGQFRQSLTVDLAVYDSGTDSGLQYASDNQDTQPREPIALVNSDSADSDLTNGQPVAGQFVFERL